MSDTTPPADGLPGIGDLLAMFGVGNPLASAGKTIEQFKRGVNDFLVAVESFNETMQTINSVAARVSRLLDDIEEPIRAAVPPLTRSIKTADAMISQISGPLEQVAPGISRLADTLGSPVFSALPTELGQFIDIIGDLGRRLQPLAQIAENAGGLFGGFTNPLAAMFGGGRSAPPAPPTSPLIPAAPEVPLAKQPAPKRTPAKRAQADTAATTKKKTQTNTAATTKKKTQASR